MSQTEDRSRTLREVAQRIEQIENRREQSNLAASTAILAGLVLDKEIIARLLRQELMGESVIYQEIREEGKQEEGVSLVLRLLRKPIGEVSVDLEKRIGGLSVEQLEDLGEAVLDFQTQADLLSWFDSD
ncbi:MAG: DUF4351 domain-containing protein [Xenococcaceae cyanobacterium MO_234.B1]|nr:DUF4351 domain-containing protein [Xenococcaceae cyanobacterium MO_234.B1]